MIIGNTISPFLQLKPGVLQFLVEYAKEETFGVYTSLGISANSENSVIYHATPDLNGEPWYDNGLVLVDEEDPASNRVIYNVGEFQAFLAVESREGSDSKLLALMHLYRARSDPGSQRKQRRDTVYDVYHKSSMTTVPNVPLPVMTFAYNPDGTPTLYLFDTESIQSAVWMQQDFDNPSNYWCIRHKASNE